MSLKKFLERRDVRQRFTNVIHIPSALEKNQLCAPPLTQDQTLVGTAFDYLFRFFLKRLYPSAVERPWLCEEIISSRTIGSIELPPPLCSAINKRYAEAKKVPGGTQIARGWNLGEEIGNYEYHIRYPDESFTQKILNNAKNLVEKAKFYRDDYVTTGEIDRSLFRYAAEIAKLDIVGRTTRLYHDLGNTDEKVIDDLFNLFALLETEKFSGYKHCILNPGLGHALRCVGGVDADCIIDDLLLEVKASKYMRLRREYIHQLIGYYILIQYDVKRRYEEFSDINNVGIYFARYGKLIKIPISNLIEGKDLAALGEWMVAYEPRSQRFHY